MSAPTGLRLQTQILEQLTELKGRAEAGLLQGRENGNELKMLRRELGLDGQHGRLPMVETSLVRHELRMEKTEARVDSLESGTSEFAGKAKLIATTLALAGGGAGGALISVMAHLLGGR